MGFLLKLSWDSHQFKQRQSKWQLFFFPVAARLAEIFLFLFCMWYLSLLTKWMCNYMKYQSGHWQEYNAPCWLQIHTIHMPRKERSTGDSQGCCRVRLIVMGQFWIGWICFLWKKTMGRFIPYFWSGISQDKQEGPFLQPQSSITRGDILNIYHKKIWKRESENVFSKWS